MNDFQFKNTSPGVVGSLAIMQRIVDESLSLIRAADGATIEVPYGDKLVYVCCSGALACSVGITVQRYASLSGLALESFATLRCDDAHIDSRVDREACEAVGVRSMVCVPLRHGPSPVGVLKVASAAPNAFDAGDVSVLTGLAEFITTTITAANALADIASALLGDRSRDATAQLDNLDNLDNAEQVARFISNVTNPGMASMREAQSRIRAVIEQEDFSIVFQPIVDLDSLLIVGAEALARFYPGPYRSPDVWIAEAHSVGLGEELELVAAKAALRSLPDFPNRTDISLNLGPTTLGHGDFDSLVALAGPRRVIIELTEHEAVASYAMLGGRLAELRRQGVRLAIDDVGSGFSGLSHIVKLAPDILKLDLELVRGIDVDPVRRSLVGALVSFAGETGASIIAEGIEYEGELEVLVNLGVTGGQGYLLGRPGPVAALANPVVFSNPS